MLQVREKDFTAQMVCWWYCAFAHFRGNIEQHLRRIAQSIYWQVCF